MRTRLRHLTPGLLASAVFLVLGLVIGGLVQGLPGALGAASGVLLVGASYTVSSVILAWADAIRPKLVLPVGLATYVLKFTVIGVVMAAVSATDWAGLPALGMAVIVSALGWMVAQAWWTWHAKIPYVEIDKPA